MRFGEIVACVAVLGYASAIKFEEPGPVPEPRNESQASSPGQNMLSDLVRDTINHIDQDNEIGMKGAMDMCDGRSDWGQFERCTGLERTTLAFMKLNDKL